MERVTSGCLRNQAGENWGTGIKSIWENVLNVANGIKNGTITINNLAFDFDKSQIQMKERKKKDNISNKKEIKVLQVMSENSYKTPTNGGNEDNMKNIGESLGKQFVNILQSSKGQLIDVSKMPNISLSQNDKRGRSALIGWLDATAFLSYRWIKKKGAEAPKESL